MLELLWIGVHVEFELAGMDFGLHWTELNKNSIGLEMDCIGVHFGYGICKEWI